MHLILVLMSLGVGNAGKPAFASSYSLLILFDLLCEHPEMSKENVLSALRQFEEEKQRDELSFSTASDGAVRKLLGRFKYTVYEEDVTALPTEAEFIPFQWHEDEKTETPRAREHLESQLKKFGVKFGRNHYRLYDVHNVKNLLSVDDPKTGKLNGQTDLIIAPYGMANHSDLGSFMS